MTARPTECWTSTVRTSLLRPMRPPTRGTGTSGATMTARRFTRSSSVATLTTGGERVRWLKLPSAWPLAGRLGGLASTPAATLSATCAA
uniref:Uncharacterized protein n=1 Tax=uncultured marine virus TaxID=186617 RepID=A0A0F7L5H4_9VIRU|nr:hypothetical protein [uncultured marine virus]